MMTRNISTSTGLVYTAIIRWTGKKQRKLHWSFTTKKNRSQTIDLRGAFSKTQVLYRMTAKIIKALKIASFENKTKEKLRDQNRGPVLQRVWHDKDPFQLIDQKCRAKIFCFSQAVVTFLHI